MPIPLKVFHVSQDDPKKNTARKLAKFGLVELEHKLARLPRGAILLDPFSQKALSWEDHAAATARGIVALDCSWRLAEEVFPAARERFVPRALPYLLAANPVNFGKPFTLSTAEALAASCAILREREQAEALMGKFNWGHSFLSLNAEPLAEYAKADSSAGVVAAQGLFVGDEEEGADGASGAADAGDASGEDDDGPGEGGDRA